MNRLARTVVSSRALIDAEARAFVGGSNGSEVGVEAGGEVGAPAAVLAVAVRAGDATFPMVEA